MINSNEAARIALAIAASPISKKYTIVFKHASENIGTFYRHVTTSNLEKLLLEDDEFKDKTYFVFEGWPKVISP